ncbi:hypothetical protein EB796_009083 [Bugula neritina]|uniref:Uncharacterized protein n=1 Tax=Bugula neritina TaxID=10212 RepID=A0A7J7K3Q8_BUGNE|nr:hypothetical protein EB796_009083 [Bugula neritina]
MYSVCNTMYSVRNTMYFVCNAMYSVCNAIYSVCSTMCSVCNTNQYFANKTLYIMYSFVLYSGSTMLGCGLPNPPATYSLLTNSNTRLLQLNILYIISFFYYVIHICLPCFITNYDLIHYFISFAEKAIL